MRIYHVMSKKQAKTLVENVPSLAAETSESLLPSKASTTLTNTPAKLVEVIKAFEVKVEIVLKELARQSEEQNRHAQSDRLFRWLTKMNEYLRNLCSGFRARLLGPMTALPEMKQKQAPLSATYLPKQQAGNGANTLVDLHRIYHSLKCAVIAVPELLLNTHLFASNQVFCSSLSELLAASERELWQPHDLQPLTERKCQQHLARMVTAVDRLLQCARIAGDWLQQHQDEEAHIPLVSIETARLQRLLNCQKLLKSKLDLVEDEISSLDNELTEANSRMEPLYQLQEQMEEGSQQAVGINESIGQLTRRINAIETEILSLTGKTLQAIGRYQPKKKIVKPHTGGITLPPLQLSTTPKPSDTREDSEVDSALTLSNVCHKEISAAQRKLHFLNYFRNIALEDIEESCMVMPFVVRQTDCMQTTVDRLETAIDERQATRLHLQNALTFINQEVECATHMCGQVELGGFTAGLGVASMTMSFDVTRTSIAVKAPAVTKKDEGADDAKNSNHDQVDTHRSNSTFVISKAPSVVYIKRRHHSQLSQQSSDNSIVRR